MTVTASREERASFDVPRAVTVIGRDARERHMPTVLPDLLRGQAGVFVQQTTPGQAAPVIRGLLGSATLMLVDGMRLNTAFFRSAPNQYFALVDPFMIDQIEVVRGAGSTLYGSDAAWLEGFLHFATDQERLSERDKDDPRINPKGTPGWVTAGLRAGWQLNEYLAVKGALENIFDKSYREHGSGINAPGVNVILTLQTRF